MLTTLERTEQENKKLTEDHLSPEENCWLDSEVEHLATVLYRAYDNFKKKKDWVKYCFESLNDIGVSYYTAYKKIRYMMDEYTNVSDSYMRTILAKDFNIKLVRGALSDSEGYYNFKKIREGYIKYVESGKKQIDDIKTNKWRREHGLEDLTRHQS